MAGSKINWLVGSVTTAAVIGYAGMVSQSASLLPTENYGDNIECCLPDNFYQDGYYQYVISDATIDDQINSIHSCVANLLNNTKDLDPRISKLIDEHFWELG